MGENPTTHRNRVKRIMRALLGATFHEYKCHARIMREDNPSLYRQCARHYGHGNAGLYCPQHAKKPDNQ